MAAVIPIRARLLLSVPPLVNTISAGLQLSSDAMISLLFSIAIRVFCPVLCGLDAFPNV
jgi:hypothetical protein